MMCEANKYRGGLIHFIIINGKEYPTRYYNQMTKYFEKIEYDDFGRIIAFENPEGRETWEYINRKFDLYKRHTFADGVVEEWEYDEAEEWRALPPILKSYSNSLGLKTYISNCRAVSSTWRNGGMVVSYKRKGRSSVFPKECNGKPINIRLEYFAPYNRNKNSEVIYFKEPGEENYPKSILLGNSEDVGILSVQERTLPHKDVYTTGISEYVGGKGDVNVRVNFTVSNSSIELEVTKEPKGSLSYEVTKYDIDPKTYKVLSSSVVKGEYVKPKVEEVVKKTKKSSSKKKIVENGRPAIKNKKGEVRQIREEVVKEIELAQRHILLTEHDKKLTQKPTKPAPTKVLYCDGWDDKNYGIPLDIISAYNDYHSSIIDYYNQGFEE